MDQNYIHNYIAFTLMDVLDLFHLAFSYCEVIINDETQGIYLITERPRDYALKTVNSPAIIRRGYDEKIDKMVRNKNSPHNSNRFYDRKFHRIYAHCRKYSGRELYDSLDSHIDMDQYMRWLAFNFLTKNGDYTDEIFLYIDPADDRFRIIPWDYDDVFSQQPHEGYESRRTVPGGKYIFSSEDRLDRAIITDKYLYDKYLEQLIDVIEILNDTTLRVLIHDAYCAIYPYYLDGEIMGTTRHDKFSSTNLPELNATLKNMLRLLKIIRNSTHLELIDMMDHSPPP
jgi:spore coat protein H